MSLAPSLVRTTKEGGTIHMFIGDTNPRYLAQMKGRSVYCDDMPTAVKYLEYWASCIAKLPITA